MRKTSTPALAAVWLAAAAGTTAAGELPDLRSRKSGSDWPVFLGPTGDGKSSEKLRTDWPLPIRWHKRVGEGYSMLDRPRPPLLLRPRPRQRPPLLLAQRDRRRDLES